MRVLAGALTQCPKLAVCKLSQNDIRSAGARFLAGNRFTAALQRLYSGFTAAVGCGFTDALLMLCCCFAEEQERERVVGSSFTAALLRLYRCFTAALLKSKRESESCLGMIFLRPRSSMP